MSKMFYIFEEYGELGLNCQINHSGVVQERLDWNWFKIYVFSKEEIDLVKEIQTLNSLLVKHGMEDYDEFCVCIKHLLLPDRSFVFFIKKRKIKKQNQQ